MGHTYVHKPAGHNAKTVCMEVHAPVHKGAVGGGVWAGAEGIPCEKEVLSDREPVEASCRKICVGALQVQFISVG